MLRDADGNLHKLLIKDCLYAEDAPANLLATSDLQKANVGFAVPAGQGPAKLCLETNSGTVEFELEKFCGLHLLPFYEEAMTVLAGVVSHRLRALNPTEIWHWRLCHTGFRKIAILSRNCVGIPRPLPEEALPCHTCYDANMRKQNAAQPSEIGEDDGTWSADMFDMGKKACTPAGNQLATVFKIKHTRWAMAYLHKSKTGVDFAKMLRKAIIQMGKPPKILRTDRAPEYCGKEAQSVYDDFGIFHQTTPPYGQSGNGLSETEVHGAGKGMRACLLDANLPVQLWGYALMHWLDCRNRVPHTALGDKSPWECEFGTKPDVSLFRVFGCRATVYVGDRPGLAHPKAAPRGVAAINLGLCTSRGYKGWICLNPVSMTLHCLRNVLSDETFMPARTHDQRILSHFDTTPRLKMAEHLHGSIADAEDAQFRTLEVPWNDLIVNMDAESETDAFDAAAQPKGTPAEHEEAAAFLESGAPLKLAGVE